MWDKIGQKNMIETKLKFNINISNKKIFFLNQQFNLEKRASHS